MHAKGLVLGEQLRDVAVRIFEVAEAQRLRDATVDAGGRGFGIDPRGQAFCQAGIDAVDAESALGRNRQPLGIEGLRLLGGRLAVGKARAVRLVARLIRTGDRAVAAAYAQLVVDGDDTAGALLGGGGWALMHARRLVAMHAADRHENTLYRRVLAHFHVEHAPPLHVRRRRVGLLARGRTGLAADAAAQVRDHGPAGHFPPPVRFKLTRTTSEPEPVASVSSIDIGTSEFMLGTPKSLANGVAQWLNCPISSSVSGRMPWRTTALALTLFSGVAISTRSRLAMPSFSAVPVLLITPRRPEILSATSRIIWMPTLLPQEYCMLREVSSQNGKSLVVPPILSSDFSHRPGKSFHLGKV